MSRQPAVAGYFYPGDAEQLEHTIAALTKPKQKTKARAIIVPHAGYVYSGAVAGEVYASVELPDRYIILCPNHTGNGSDFDISPDEEWFTPLGAARVDQDLVEQMMSLFPRAKKDGRAHAREHSLEVQLPFLQYLKGRISFLPLCIRQFQFEYLKELGHAIAQIVSSSSEPILIISSTDMTHYESQESANRKDRIAIEQMERLEPAGLYDAIHQHNISMCGYLPTTATLVAMRELGAEKAKLVRYATSGDVTQDFSSVVGYAGLLIE